MAKEEIVLGGGCFWCIECLFTELKGVERVESGYSGGSILNPTYKEICTGTTGHAEVIRITFESETISRNEILDIFFTLHDPTTLNRQGNDSGPQYRSVIFYANPEQETAARAAKERAQSLWDQPIVTEISPLINYFQAEDYHQNYYNNNPYQPYCAFVITPKVKKFRELYREKRKV